MLADVARIRVLFGARLSLSSSATPLISACLRDTSHLVGQLVFVDDVQFMWVGGSAARAAPDA
jgi:hypothetical protein